MLARPKPISSLYSDNKVLSFPAAIYLPLNSRHLSFLAIVFSCLPYLTPWSLLRDVWGILAGCLSFFSPLSMPTFLDWPMKPALKLPCFPLNMLGNIKGHTLWRARVQMGSDAIQTSSLVFPLLLLLRSPVSPQCCWRRRIASRGRGEEEEAASQLACVSIMCHGHSWLSCSVWLSLLLQQSLFPR